MGGEGRERNGQERERWGSEAQHKSKEVSGRQKGRWEGKDEDCEGKNKGGERKRREMLGQGGAVACTKGQHEYLVPYEYPAIDTSDYF